jgi:uncharacterized protein (TIGR02186 family)
MRTLAALLAGLLLIAAPSLATAQPLSATGTAQAGAGMAAPDAAAVPQLGASQIVAGPAEPGQERLVSTLSKRTVSITSGFDGEMLSLFGNIEPAPDSGARFVAGPYDVIVVVVGPLQGRVARLATRNLGVWINTEHVDFQQVPSFYQVLSSAPLEQIITPEQLAAEAIPPASHLMQAKSADPETRARFAVELERLMTKAGRFGIDPSGIRFLSQTAYTGQVTLPPDVASGTFVTRTYLVKDRQIVSRRTEGFSVRKIGFERFLGEAANQQPLLYGLVCVMLALFTGWLGGVVFKR